MDEILEGQEPHKTPEGEGTPETPIELTPKEIEDLRHKAAVSSQNFERAKKAEDEKKLLEEQLRQLQKTAVPSNDDIFSDEGKVLHQEITSLKSELSEIKGELTMEKLFVAYPILKDKQTEFNDFRVDPENSGMSLRTAAKAFLIDKGLIEASKPERKGLEGATGGRKETQPSGLTADKVAELRVNNYKKYLELLKAGKLDDIK